MIDLLTTAECARLAKAVGQRTPGELRACNGDIEIVVTQRRSRLLFAPVGASYADAHAFAAMGNNFANMLDTIADFYHTSGDLCPKCSWRGERGNGCEFCALVEARTTIAVQVTAIAAITRRAESAESDWRAAMVTIAELRKQLGEQT